MKALQKPEVEARGVLLSQHLELRDRYLEELVDDWLEPLFPFGWGLAQLDLDLGAIARGVIRVVRLAARFPSGELAHLRSGASLELALPTAGVSEDAVDVFVGLADLSTAGPNASPDDKAATRYRSLAGRAGGRGPTLRPKLRLYLGTDGELPSDRIRITRVRTTRTGVEVDPEVLPPTLWPLAGTFLPGAVAAVVSALSARQAQLLAARRARPHEPLTFPAALTPQLVALSAIQQALAALAHPASPRGLPPWDLHEVLAELLGAIESADSDPVPIPGYEHGAAGPGFREIVSRLLVAIPAVARPPHEAFAFVRRDLHTFELKLPDPALLRRGLHLVLVGGERGALEQGVPAYAKVASDAWMPQIVQTAVRGVDLAPDFDPPPSLPSSAESACFRLNTRSEYWADVLERGTLLLFLPSAPRELQAALYVTGGVGP